MVKHNKKARKLNALAKHPYKPQTRPSQGQAQAQPRQHNGKARPQASQAAPVPFDARDDILLVGEGDFSFAHCLHTHYARRYTTLTATTLESQNELFQKYPQARAYVADLLGERHEIGGSEIPSVGQTDGNGLHEDKGRSSKLEQPGTDLEDEDGNAKGDESDFEGFSPSNSPATFPAPPIPSTTSRGDPTSTTSTNPTSIHYSIDGTRLTSYKPLRSTPYSTVIFNFPHVGGKSTDVNRQVRANQEMLQKFLGEAKAVLVRGVGLRSQRTRAAKDERSERAPDEQRRDHEVKKSERWDTDEEDKGSDEENGTAGDGGRNDTGKTQPVPKVIVTLFEGEPYTLWNIKDLARSVGLECRRSWRFDWSMWPGYRHARTLGNLRQRAETAAPAGREEVDSGAAGEEERGDGEAMKGKARGPGWKGEERDARTYEFGLKGWDERGKKGGKRKRDHGGNESD